MTAKNTKYDFEQTTSIDLQCRNFQKSNITNVGQSKNTSNYVKTGSSIINIDNPVILTPRPVILTPYNFGLKRTSVYDKISV